MDEFTFGNSKAAIDLAKMVAEKYPSHPEWLVNTYQK